MFGMCIIRDQQRVVDHVPSPDPQEMTSEVDIFIEMELLKLSRDRPLGAPLYLIILLDDDRFMRSGGVPLHGTLSARTLALFLPSRAPLLCFRSPLCPLWPASAHGLRLTFCELAELHFLLLLRPDPQKLPWCRGAAAPPGRHGWGRGRPAEGAPPTAPWLTCSRPSVCPPPTPWQELRTNPSTYEGHPGGFGYLLIELRSEMPRGLNVDHHVRSAGSRAVRNEGHRTVRRGPVGPCRSVLQHKFACLACSHSCIMFMVDIPNNWQRISNRYEGRESIPVKPVTSQNRYI